jgi:hypothetical protein
MPSNICGQIYVSTPGSASAARYDAGLCRRAASKRDCWHDMAWMQLDLLDTGGVDGPPGPIR